MISINELASESEKSWDYISENIDKNFKELSDLINEKISESVANDRFPTKEEASLHNKIYYMDGYSDKNGDISSEIVTPTDEYDVIIISRMYLHPSLNMWCNCVSYKPTGDEIIITGGIKYGVSVVVGGTEAQRFPNCLYRTFYIKVPKIKS